MGEDGHVSGPQRAPVEGRAPREQPGDLRGAVAGDERAHRPDRDGLAGLLDTGARHGPQPHGGQQPVGRDAVGDPQARALAGGAHRVDDDLLVAELRPAEERTQTAHERPVGAVVDPEGVPGRRRLGGGEIGVDVAAAEPVDRLLGVTDEHEGAVPAEGPVEDLPLHRVGVLELVDEHHPPALAHPLAGRRVLVLEGGGEVGEQVVVAEHPEPPLAAVELLAHQSGEAQAPGVGGAPLEGAGVELGMRIFGDGPGDLAGALAGEGRRAPGGEAADVEVVDDLVAQVRQVLDESGVLVGVAGDTQPPQHELAELVRRRDRRRVEVGQCVAKPPRPLGHLLGRALAQQGDDLVVGGQVGVGHVPVHVPQVLADSLAHLPGGGAAEGNDEHVLEPHDSLGDVPGDEGTDGPRLARAGARPSRTVPVGSSPVMSKGVSAPVVVAVMPCSRRCRAPDPTPASRGWPGRCRGRRGAASGRRREPRSRGRGATTRRRARRG